MHTFVYVLGTTQGFGWYCEFLPLHLNGELLPQFSVVFIAVGSSTKI